MENEDIIIIDSLTKDYGQGRGIFNVSFSVHKGECFGFLGPNGAGKSTTISALLGLIKIDDGEIKIDGKDIKRQLSMALKLIRI